MDLDAFTAYLQKHSPVEPGPMNRMQDASNDSPPLPGAFLPSLTAMVCCGLVTAQFVGSKAVRDALYLAQFEVTSLPTMVIVTSILSIALVTANSRILTSLLTSPHRAGDFCASVPRFCSSSGC